MDTSITYQKKHLFIFIDRVAGLLFKKQGCQTKMKFLEIENFRLSEELKIMAEDSARQNEYIQQLVEVLIVLCKQTPILCAQLENVTRQTESAATGIINRCQDINDAAEHHSLDLNLLANSYRIDSSAEENEILSGINILAKAIEAFDSRAIYNQSLEESVKKLVDSSESIKAFVADISDIASQTNFLSLNAAIEAAHAGKAGASFSVIAQEIRKLSGRSTQAGKNISSLAAVIGQNLALVRESLTDSVMNDQKESQKGREIVSSIRKQIEAEFCETAEHLEKIQQDDKDIRSQVSKAMVSLQFQDFTRQEIEHVLSPLGEMYTRATEVLGNYNAFFNQIKTPSLKNQYTIEIEHQIDQLVSKGENTSKLTRKLDQFFLEGVQTNKKEDDLVDNFTLF